MGKRLRLQSTTTIAHSLFLFPLFLYLFLFLFPLKGLMPGPDRLAHHRTSLVLPILYEILAVVFVRELS